MTTLQQLQIVNDELAALRIEHEAHAALLDVTRRDRDEARAEANTTRLSLFASQKAWTEVDNRVRVLEPEVILSRQERDEARADLAATKDAARKALAREMHNHGITIDQRDNSITWADSLANQIAAAADHEIGEHSNLNNPWDNAQDGLVKLVKERDALRARVAELERHEASIHKAADAARKAERADVVAWLRKHAAGMVLVNQHDNVRLRGNCYLNAANVIERGDCEGAHEGAAEVKRG